MNKFIESKVIYYSVKVEIAVTCVIKRTGSTEHFLACNTFLVPALLNERAQSFADSVWSLDAPDLKNRSCLISCIEDNRTYTEDLLTKGLLERNVENTVKQDLFRLDVEDTGLEVELILAETVDGKRQRKAKISLAVLPKNLFILCQICKPVYF